MKLTAAQATAALLDPMRQGEPAIVRSLRDSRSPGLYAWFADAPGARAIAAGLDLPLGPGLIYAGQAGAGRSTATLGSRVGGNHVGGSIRGSTFRLTLASVLRTALRLEPDGQRLPINGEARLTKWVLAHLRVAIISFEDRLELNSLESDVLGRLDPPLNIAKRPPTPIRMRLTELRRSFARSALRARVIDQSPTRAWRSASSAPPSRRRLDRLSTDGPTPEELALELGLANANRLRAFLRETSPRPTGDLWSRWGPLDPDVIAAVKSRFGKR